MLAVKLIVVWGAVAIGSAFVAAIVAGMRNRDPSAWAAWCFLFPPAVLMVALMPTRKGSRPRRPTLDEEDAREA